MSTSKEDDDVRYWHVDVFSNRPLAGNGLTVVEPKQRLSSRLMLGVTRELRQFETVFLFDSDSAGATARVFTPEEELRFAGHPVLGAAAVLHQEWRPSSVDADWTITLGGRPIEVKTHLQHDGVVLAQMNQGPANLSPPLDGETALRLAPALGLSPEHLHGGVPAQVVSTGLPYLLFPVTPVGLVRSHVASVQLEAHLTQLGAEFVYVLDPDSPEGRTWDRSGRTEDVATGSAAGPVAAYLVEHGLRDQHHAIEISQGRFVGRPSTITAHLEPSGDVWVGGPVAAFAAGTLRLGAEPL